MSRPVMVVGPMRSSTTFVARLLGSHRDAHYLGFELCEQWAEWTGQPFAAPGAWDRHCPPLDARDVTPGVHARVREGLRRRLAAERGRDRPAVLVLKNPHLWHRLPYLRAVLPGVRFVRCRRDPVQLVASLRRLFRRSQRGYGVVHHLPVDPTHCWDLTPVAEQGGLDPARCFPGGDLEVLVDYVVRVDARLDAELEGAGDHVATVDHDDIVSDLDAVVQRLQTTLDLAPTGLRPPAPVDPGRTEDHLDLLDEDQRERVRTALARRGTNAGPGGLRDPSAARP